MFIKSGLQKCSSEINKADLNSAIESNPFKKRHLFHGEVSKNGKAKLNSLEIYPLLGKKPTHYYGGTSGYR